MAVKIEGEQIGWAFSAALHVGIVVFAVAGISDWLSFRDDPIPEAPPAIDIQFEKIADQTRVVEPEPTGEAEEAKPAPSRPAVANEEASAPEPSEAVPLPSNVPAPAKAKPTPPKKPTVSKLQKLAAKVRPNSKPKPPSRLRNISSVIDRAAKEEERGRSTDTEEEVVKKSETANVDPLAGLRKRFGANTASLRDALSQKLSGCWTFPSGAKGVRDMRVTVRIWLRQDGKLARAPEYIGVRGLDDPDNAFFRTFAESARRAVVLCEPYQKEAAVLYEQGNRYIDFNFSGREFAGG